jgi:flagellar protein FliO/FliZ
MPAVVTWSDLMPALHTKLRAVLTLWLAWVPAALAAVEEPARRFAEPTASSATPAPAAGLAQVTLSLVLVLAAIFAAAWLLRRFRTLASGKSDPGSAIVVLAERAVGPRERVVLLQVGRERVLVGVTSGSVRALHVMDGAVNTADTDTSQ